MRYAGSKYTTKAEAEAASRYPSARSYGNEYLMTSSSSMMANRLGCNASTNHSPSNYTQFAGQAALQNGLCGSSALSNQAAGSSSQLGSKSQGYLDLLIGSLFGL